MPSATEILRFRKPESLFSGSPDEVKRQFRDLAKQYHPDGVCGAKGFSAGEEVFAHVSHLYSLACEKIQKGTWGQDAVVTVEHESGTIDIKFITDRPFELGHVYVDHDRVSYIVGPDYKELFHNCLKTKGFRFASKRMEEQIASYLPQNPQAFKLKNGSFLVQFDKDPRLLNLRDILDYYGGRIPGKHVAWILGTLHNLACYLNFSKISHQDISLDTYFINPEQHTGALIGGWWYAKKFGDRVKNVPVRTMSHLPFKVKVTKKAHKLTDLELIRVLGREMLGDPTGQVLHVPNPMFRFLNSIATKNAIETYREWGEVRDACGPRKFIPMKLTAGDLYG